MTAWHEGRTFYACHCGTRDERLSVEAPHPATLPCWQSGCDRTMEQWIPPAVKRERNATAALSATQGTLI